MHEISIATAIWELAHDYLPEKAVLRCVRIHAGPMRAIDPDSMRWAWNALMLEKGAKQIALELTMLPWELQCAACGRQWTAHELERRCTCGSDQIRLTGGNELQMVSIEVDDAAPEPDNSRKYSGSAI